MSGSSGTPWSTNPNAPSISQHMYSSEKVYFAGTLVGVMCHGVVIGLFLRCMRALLDPSEWKNKWRLVIHTTAMFLFATAFAATNIQVLVNRFVDEPAFPDSDSRSTSGPLGYSFLDTSEAANVISNVTPVLNNWLAEGLLLYRCCIIYDMNYRIVPFLCLAYLISLVVGIIFMYQASQPRTSVGGWAVTVTTLCFSISLSLNILFTLLIGIRLAILSRRISKAVGRTTTLYRDVVTMLVESSSLYACVSMIFAMAWNLGGSFSLVHFPMLVQLQVVSSFLLVLRAADRRASLNDPAAPGLISSIHFMSKGGSTGRNGTIPDELCTDSADPHNETCGEPTSQVGTAAEEVAL